MKVHIRRKHSMDNKDICIILLFPYIIGWYVNKTNVLIYLAIKHMFIIVKKQDSMIVIFPVPEQRNLCACVCVYVFLL